MHKSFFESEDSTKMKTVRRPKFLSSDWNVRLEAYRDTSERIIRDQWKRERESKRGAKSWTQKDFWGLMTSTKFGGRNGGFLRILVDPNVALASSCQCSDLLNSNNDIFSSVQTVIFPFANVFCL